MSVTILINDYAVAYKEVLLAYGRYTGGNTVYNDLASNGARVIVLREGERKFDTYIRIANNEIESFVTFPNVSINQIVLITNFVKPFCIHEKYIIVLFYTAVYSRRTSW